MEQMNFHRNHPEVLPNFCTHLQLRFNDVMYRIDFTESEVNSVCASNVCQAAMIKLTLSCLTFVSIVLYVCV